MFAVYIEDQKVRLQPSALIGEGGEAEVYKLDDQEVLKLFKQPNHPQFKSDLQSAQAARLRLQEHQTKLEQFPKLLIPHVVSPVRLAYDKNQQADRRVVGYTMSRITQVNSMHEFSQRNFQESKDISIQTIVDVFSDLHASVSALHASGVIIGDFNNLNVLVSGKDAYIVDTDSMQFSTYTCKTFTNRYADPRVLKLTNGQIELCARFSKETDWYSFSTMLFEALLNVHPYGGVYKPKSPMQRVSPEQRALNRISVFHKDVSYPMAGRKIQDILSRDLTVFFEALLQDDVRTPFPLPLLLDMLPSKKSASGTTKANVASNGKSQIVFATDGVILNVTHDGSNLRYLYNLEERFIRENGQVVLKGKVDSDLRFALQNSSTFAGKGKRLVHFAQDSVHNQIVVDQFRGREPVFDCNHRTCYIIEDGQLFSIKDGRKSFIDEVLKEQTRIWAGPSFGFGFYIAGEFRRAFLFDDETTGRKLLDVDATRGTLLRVSCRFTERQLWLLVTYEEKGQVFNRVTAFNDCGSCLGTCEIPDGNGSWMDGLHQSCAAAIPDRRGGMIETLLVPTNSGIAKVEADATSLRIAQEFTEPEQILEAGDNLIFTHGGLYAWNSKSIRLLSIS